MFFFAAALCVLAGCRSVPRDVPPVELKPGSTVRIVVPAKQPLPEAAALIRKGLEGTIGVNAVVESEGQRHGFNGFKGTTFFLGDTKAIRGIGFEPRKIDKFHAVIVTCGGDIFIAGSDRDLAGKKNFHGTFAGTVYFAEKYLGGKSLLPDGSRAGFAKKELLIIPENLSFQVPFDWDKKESKEKSTDRQSAGR